uniref:Integrin beta-1-binding protein 1 n=2 Tax=Rhinolophus ferrumequinum TaxID=59479 RepID=A0A671EM70_RHIFE
RRSTGEAQVAGGFLNGKHSHRDPKREQRHPPRAQLPALCSPRHQAPPLDFRSENPAREVLSHTGSENLKRGQDCACASSRRRGRAGGARRPEKLALELEREWLSRRRVLRRWVSDLDHRRPQGWVSGCESVDSSLGGLSRSSTVASLDTDSTKSSGQSNNNSDTCAEFRIKYVGAIEKLKLSEGKNLEGPLDLINYIDVAQQDGKLPFVPLEEEFIMGVSKYGIKVSTSDQYAVLHRHALYLIIRMVCYDDGLGAGRSLLALKTTDASNEEYSLWVYQCNSLEQAQTICKVLATAFDSVLTSDKS